MQHTPQKKSSPIQVWAAKPVALNKGTYRNQLQMIMKLREKGKMGKTSKQE